MKCEACGFTNRPGAHFCKSCGAALVSDGADCPACGASVRLGAHFCPQCGAALVQKPSPPQPPRPPEPIVAEDGVSVGGQISGQVTIANYSLTFGDVNGGVVNVSLPEQRREPRPRPTPIDLRPRLVPGFLDREAAIDVATVALGDAPVEVTGVEGIGKTALLSALAHHPSAAAFPDGVIHLSARNRPVDDLLRFLFDAFYETDLDFHPTESQVRHALQGKRAIVLLDDVALSRQQIEVVLNAAPSCAFIIASGQRVLWAGGAAVDLPGLPPDDAVALIEQRLERQLSGEEEASARQICEALDGHPLRLIQAASLARDEGRGLDDVLLWAATYSPMAPVDELSKSERAVLAMLAAVGDWPVPIAHIPGLTGVRDAPAILEGLEQHGLVQAHSPRYSPAGEVGATLRHTWDLDPWREQALGFYANWAEREHVQPRHVLEAADVAVHLLEWAAGKQCWQAVLRLGRAIEAALALGGRWAAWVRVLRLILQAARALGMQAAEAWALHQIGTRAMCLGSKNAARDALNKALQLRHALGDKAAATITQHNLDLLLGPPPPPKKKPTEKAPKPPAPKGSVGAPFLKVVLILMAGAVVVAGVAAAAIIWANWPPGGNVIEEPTATPTVTPTPTPEPRVEIELLEGCGTIYQPGGVLTFDVRTNMGGLVEVSMVSSGGERINLFSQTFEADVSESWEWDAPNEPGEWELVAELNGGEAEGRCPFVVEAPPPVIESTSVITEGEGLICPGDNVTVRVAIAFGRPLYQVLFWFRNPPDTGIWFSEEMMRIDDWTYDYVISAPEQPGIEFYVSVEDVDGQLVQAEPQVYFTGPCIY